MCRASRDDGGEWVGRERESLTRVRAVGNFRHKFGEGHNERERHACEQHIHTWIYTARIYAHICTHSTQRRATKCRWVVRALSSLREKPMCVCTVYMCEWNIFAASFALVLNEHQVRKRARVEERKGEREREKRRRLVCMCVCVPLPGSTNYISNPT